MEEGEEEEGESVFTSGSGTTTTLVGGVPNGALLCSPLFFISSSCCSSPSLSHSSFTLSHYWPLLFVSLSRQYYGCGMGVERESRAEWGG